MNSCFDIVDIVVGVGVGGVNIYAKVVLYIIAPAEQCRLHTMLPIKSLGADESNHWWLYAEWHWLPL